MVSMTTGFAMIPKIYYRARVGSRTVLNKYYNGYQLTMAPCNSPGLFHYVLEFLEVSFVYLTRSLI